jgi:hypothetical protein
MAVVPQKRICAPCADQKYAVDVYPEISLHRKGSNTFKRIAFDDMICDGATMVDSYIPMLNPEWLAALLRVRKRRNIT